MALTIRNVRPVLSTVPCGGVSGCTRSAGARRRGPQPGPRLEVAYQTFAADGLSVPIDEIARRAGVGAGTVYRHFPTKDMLFQAVIADRLRRIIDDGYALLSPKRPARRCLSSCGRWCCSGAPPIAAWSKLWPASALTSTAQLPQAEDDFLGLLAELLRAAQQTGAARSDVSVAQVKTLLVGCQAMQSYNAELAETATEHRSGRTSGQQRLITAPPGLA